MKRAYQYANGFVLNTVLLMLLILAVLVSVLLSNQTLFVRQTSDFLSASMREQASHNVHRLCVQKARQLMSIASLQSGVVLDQSRSFEVVFNHVIGQCQIEAGWVDAPLTWQPHIRIVSVVGTQTEITDWRYPACVTNAGCFAAQSTLVLKKVDAPDAVRLRPQFRLDSDVQTVWRKI